MTFGFSAEALVGGDGGPPRRLRTEELAGGGIGPPILAVAVSKDTGTPLELVAEMTAGGANKWPPFEFGLGVLAAAHEAKYEIENQIWTLYGDGHAGDTIAGTPECRLKDKKLGDWFFWKDLMFGGWPTGLATKDP